MQALKAAKEKPLKPFCNASFDIVKLGNPMECLESFNCYTSFCNGLNGTLDDRETSVIELSTRLGKHSRVKKTVPKRPNHVSIQEENCLFSPDSNDSEADFHIYHTPPETPPAQKRRKKVSRHDIGKSNVHEFETLEEKLTICDGSEDYDNFRRFSSRRRKQTNFLGVEYDKCIEGGRARRGRGNRLAGASRKLIFPSKEFQFSHCNQENLGIVDVRPSCDADPKVDIARKEREEPREKELPVVATEDKDPADISAAEPEETKPITRESFELEYPIGSMVWGKLPGYHWWSGNVISYDCVEGLKDDKDETEEDGESNVPQAWIKWYGETQLSKISAEKLAHFHNFKDYFQPLQLKRTYKKAVFAALKEAARRCKMEFLSLPDDKKPRWILSEDSPLPKLISEKEELGNQQEDFDQQEEETHGEEESISDEKVSIDEKESSSLEDKKQELKPKVKGRGGRGKRGRGKGEKAVIRLTSLEQEMIEWACGGFLPAGENGLLPAEEEQQDKVRVVPIGGGAEEEKGGASLDDSTPKRKQKVMLLHVRSKARFNAVIEGRAKLSDMCIGCGDFNVFIEHPLFNGGLCLDCKNEFMETSYLFDEDGSQMYCTICSAGEEVFMCDAENCSKSYCAPCVEKLCGVAELDRVKASAEWLCYMCSPDHNHVGLLEKREDWDRKLRELFVSDHEMEYDPPTFYRPLPPEERRPIRVLGLFDGIATGLVVLKELGIEVEQYVSSEIDIDAVYVSRVQHKEIIHVGDIERITEKEVKAWGPFDLIMGGSPCNDLSVVNPARRGIYEGTGRLFFEFYRILSYTRPAPDEDRPFFWLFENVVSMKPHDKQTISRFLQSNPVVVDARDMSAAHRARYFWGNLPGMNRPTIPLPSDRLTLQSCLEPHCFRVAQFTKLRTITTKMNSIKQTKKAILPVRVEGQDEDDQGDVLWCTEMERLFGFPEHYTDVANLGRAGRQRLLGKAWSVPVIRHLLSPLKDYFKSSTTMEGQNNSCAAVKTSTTMEGQNNSCAAVKSSTTMEGQNNSCAAVKFSTTMEGQNNSCAAVKTPTTMEGQNNSCAAVKTQIEA